MSSERERILSLSGRQLDWVVIRQVFGDRIKGDHWLDQREMEWKDISAVPCFSSDYNACRQMEDELERRGLVERYCKELDRLVGPGIWWLIHASATDRCRAALLAVQTKEL
jgi:hypothetical protein